MPGTFQSITPSELNRIMRSKPHSSYMLIDLRESYVYQTEHINGALNIDYDTFMQMRDYEKFVLSGKMIILYCERGGRSVYAAKQLAQYVQNRNNKGMNSSKTVVCHLLGGMTAYRKYR